MNPHSINYQLNSILDLYLISEFIYFPPGWSHLFAGQDRKMTTPKCRCYDVTAQCLDQSRRIYSMPLIPKGIWVMCTYKWIVSRFTETFLKNHNLMEKQHSLPSGPLWVSGYPGICKGCLWLIFSFLPPQATFLNATEMTLVQSQPFTAGSYTQWSFYGIQL